MQHVDVDSQLNEWQNFGGKILYFENVIFMFVKPPGNLLKRKEMLKTISGSRHLIPMTENSRTFLQSQLL